MIQFAGRARYVVARRLAPTQHVAGVDHLFMVDARGKPIFEGIPAEVSPEIAAASQIFPVPIDLRIVPELVTDRPQIFLTVALLIFLASDGRLPGWLPHEISVANRGEFRIPADLRLEAHPEPGRHFPRQWNFVLVVAEHHELPG